MSKRDLTILHLLLNVQEGENHEKSLAADDKTSTLGRHLCHRIQCRNIMRSHDCVQFSRVPANTFISVHYILKKKIHKIDLQPGLITVYLIFINFFSIFYITNDD